MNHNRKIDKINVIECKKCSSIVFKNEYARQKPRKKTKTKNVCNIRVYHWRL